ncbi:hypothetical protein VKT23_001094 [Stygiomarasmius scandens]|uniref:Mid2 domain-containing protein n=1 Tax=Marasmiellus scandens TaxID=2682957 RepID=A0ABR1K8I0_9AGAR
MASLTTLFVCSTLILQAFAIPKPKGGGGGHSSGGSRGSSSYRAPVVVNHSSTKCFDEHGQPIPCPKNKNAAIIAGIVIGSVVGAILIGILIYYLVKWRRSRAATTSRSLPAYQKLDESAEPKDTTLPALPVQQGQDSKALPNVKFPTPTHTG